MVIKIMPVDKGSPNGKLADAELHFTDGELQGLKLIGFAVWERKAGNGRNVTFPARQYTVGGERRSFALLLILLAAWPPATATSAAPAASVQSAALAAPPAHPAHSGGGLN